MPLLAWAAPRISSTASGCSGCLQLDGYELVNDPQGADFAVVNTCGFIEQARQESFAVIDEMLELKRQGHLRGVIVSGCLAERQKEALLVRSARDRSVGRRVRPRGSDQGCRPADRRAARTAERVSTRPDAPLAGHLAAADHAQAFRILENLRRLRSALHVLCDSQDAGQARHQADGRGDCRGPANWPPTGCGSW